MRIRIVIGVLVLAVLWVLWRSVFTVGEAQSALVMRFGRVAASALAPGLHWKSPLDEVHRFDQRLRTDAYPGEMLLTADGKTLSADLYVRWRVRDGLRYYQAVGGNARIAAARIADVIRDRVRDAATQVSAAQLAARVHAGLAAGALERINAALMPLGVSVTDVQFERVDLPDDVASAVYQRMQEGFAARAQLLRSEGNAAAGNLRMQAESHRAATLADGTRDAQRIRADADAQVSATYARAYGSNPEFAAFDRSLQAYRESLGLQGDVFVVSPDSEFFKYLRSASGR